MSDHVWTKCGQFPLILSPGAYVFTCILVSVLVCDVFTMQKLQRRIKTFGLDFHKHLEITHCNIPIIVTKCINELDERGAQIDKLIFIFNLKNLCRFKCQGNLQVVRSKDKNGKVVQGRKSFHFVTFKFLATCI